MKSNYVTTDPTAVCLSADWASISRTPRVLNERFGLAAKSGKVKEQRMSFLALVRLACGSSDGADRLPSLRISNYERESSLKRTL